jgi:hypothetical protein
MQFTYTYLKNAEKNDIKLGNWDGHSVYAIHKTAIEEEDYYTNFAYVIYDDNNLLFYDGRIYGEVKSDGRVIESKSRPYIVKKHKEAFTEPVREEYKSETIGDVNLEIEVDKMLKNGRGTTIEELLKGFDYGL